MLRLCICDDDPEMTRALERLLLEYSFQKELDIETVKFASPVELLRSGCGFDIVFLDIQFDGDMNGIEAARELRRRGDRCLIVLITVHEGFSIKGYEAEAFRFLVKPLGMDDVFRAMDECIRKLYRGAIVEIRTSQGIELVRAGEILYVTSANRRRVVVTADGLSLETWAQMGDIQSALPPDMFSMAQQGFLVNLDRVRLLNGRSAVLTDGTEVALSRKYKDSFLRALRGHLRYS